MFFFYEVGKCGKEPRCRGKKELLAISREVYCVQLPSRDGGDIESAGRSSYRLPELALRACGDGAKG